MGAMLSQNLIRTSDQPVVYASILPNKVEQNYSTTQRSFNNGFFFAQVQTLFICGSSEIPIEYFTLL
jgi:hypothetical protein